MMVYRHAAILAALLLICATTVAAPDAKRQAQLEHLLAQDCGACHGLHMTGGLGPDLTRA
ncbi:MAG: cytochrome c, partial [Pseudomonas sp.]